MASVKLESMADVFRSFFDVVPPFVFFSVALPLIIILYFFVFTNKSSNKNAKKKRVPQEYTIKDVKESQITALIIYPIKSCAGISLKECDFDVYGLEWDRRWMLAFKRTGKEPSEIDKNDGRTKAGYRMLSQRLSPKMSLIQPRLTDNAIVVTAPGCKPLKLPKESDESGPKISVDLWATQVIGIDEGDECAKWFSDFLDQECRLVRMPVDHQRAVSKRFEIDGLHNTASFADGFPFLLTTNASLEDLNSRLDEALPMARFRPNIVVSLSPKDYEPWVEDTWRRFTLGKEVFYCAKPCSRCKLTTVDPAKGEFGGEEPLETLRKFRKRKNGQVYFGQNLLHEAKSGTLHVGDKLNILERRPDDWDLLLN